MILWTTLSVTIVRKTNRDYNGGLYNSLNSKGGNEMRELKTNFKKDYENVSNQIESMKPTDENYKELVTDKDNIRNELIKIRQAEMEYEIKLKQIEAENIKELIRTGVTVGTFLIASSIGIWKVVKTFKFDIDGTLTSTLGDKILNSDIPKNFKW